MAEAFIKGAAARGVTTLAADLVELCAMEAAHGRAELIAALERAVAFGRFRAHDVRSILGRGNRCATAPCPGRRLIVDLPVVATRSLDDYAIGEDQ